MRELPSCLVFAPPSASSCVTAHSLQLCAVVAMLRRLVALTTNQCSKQAASACNEEKQKEEERSDVVPRLLSCNNPAGLTKRKFSICLFVVQCRFGDAGLPPPAHHANNIHVGVCVLVCLPPQTSLCSFMHVCMLRCYMRAEQHAFFNQSRVGKILFYNEVISASCPT